MINEMMLVGQVIVKIVTEMFFNGAGVFIMILFGTGALYIKSLLEGK